MRLLAVSLALVLGLTLSAQEKKGPPPPPKNLKILTDASQVRPTMAFFRASLGVQCTHCHVMGDFASDENPKKNIARAMMGMVDKINAGFPDGKAHVSCFTCHRGAVEPLITPPAAPAQ